MPDSLEVRLNELLVLVGRGLDVRHELLDRRPMHRVGGRAHGRVECQHARMRPLGSPTLAIGGRLGGDACRFAPAVCVGLALDFFGPMVQKWK